MMTADDVLKKLTTRTFGRTIRVYPTAASTNDVAKELALAGAPEGEVVVALDQTEGRGRQDRTWLSGAGLDLTFSIILRPPIPANLLGLISLHAAVAVARTVSALTGKEAGCKWPNDVLVGGKKISGILCESSITGQRAGWVVAGIGINVNRRSFPPEIAGTATSIAIETGRETDLSSALAATLDSMEASYLPGAPSWPGEVVAGWTGMNVILGSRVSADVAGRRIQGIARSVTPGGALRIDTAEGTLELAAGDVHLL